MSKEIDKLFSDKKIAYSFKLILQYFLDRGATVDSIFIADNETYAILNYQGIRIPIKTKDELFFSILNSSFGKVIGFNKLSAYKFLKLYGIPGPTTYSIEDRSVIKRLLKQDRQVVVKPRNGAHGDGVTLGIKTLDEVDKAIQHARKFRNGVIAQEQVTGEEYRLLFVNFQLVGAIRRHHPFVIGDGQSTIAELIEQANLDRDKYVKSIVRYKWQEMHAAKISVAETERTNTGAFLDRVPAKAKKIQLFNKGNIGLGGISENATNLIGKDVIEAYSRLLRDLDLPLCGIDVISQDISSPLSENKTFVIEINTAPGLMMHHMPYIGRSRPVDKVVAGAIYAKHKSLQKQT
ncbi:MAG TPA: ATP-grasp domain-containing protein [Candidatus Saccharimonadales bacterium]|nr:ATP-grasp domain-containing protein [Candidatus Saccharimonadales bacterium]